jgi:hypothetical protein
VTLLNKGRKLIALAVGLPWRQQNLELPDNIGVATKWFESLKWKLTKDPDLKLKYSQTMEGYIERGHAMRLNNVSKTERTWYFPHHPVTNPNKPGKVRVVFECAAKFQGKSLNNFLLQGPDLVNDLVGVLLRFRQGRIAIAADIEQMFHQVRVLKKDYD